MKLNKTDIGLKKEKKKELKFRQPIKTNIEL